MEDSIEETSSTASIEIVLNRLFCDAAAGAAYAILATQPDCQHACSSACCIRSIMIGGITATGTGRSRRKRRRRRSGAWVLIPGGR